MPASEQAWRDPKKLHVIFMASSLAMLGTTMWMFYADHNREWKKNQDTVRSLDLTTNEWSRIQYTTEAKLKEKKQLEDSILKTKVSALDEGLLKEFESLLKNEAIAKRIDARQTRLKELVEKAKAKEAAAGKDEAAKSKSAKDLLVAEEQAAEEHDSFVQFLCDQVVEAKFHENTILDNRKKRSGQLDAAKAKVDIGVRDSLDEKTMNQLEAEVDTIRTNLEKLNLEYQTASKFRKDLEKFLKRITTVEDEAKKALATNESDLDNLKKAYVDRRMTYFVDKFPYLGKKWLTWPILDAFNSPRKIDNLWSDGLTIDYNFQKVRRFDRCTTCHQSMEKSMPGQADKALYVKQELLNFTLPTPAEKPAADKTTLEDVYGMRLASSGALVYEDVTLSYVAPQSLAAKAEFASGTATLKPGSEIRDALLETNKAEEQSIELYPTRPGFMFGDVITKVNEDIVYTQEEAERFLLKSVQWGKPVTVEVRRGMNSPYISHPRLDLYVGSLSPHKLQTFACSICHEGQGSATQFKWASHMPNDPIQRKEWEQKYGWVDNHHWIFPMYPKRFAESACLKCHHNVVELEPSERFVEAPAPKVTHGYHLLRKYGCYGCHEVTGFDGPNRRVGPDMRIEPNFFAGALEIKAQLQKKSGDTAAFEKLSLNEKDWINTLIEHPDRDDARHRLSEMILVDEKIEKSKQRFGGEVHKLAAVLKDVETPGDLRKPGPSLRFVDKKLDDQFLYDWIREPKHFRPDTRMPQFFGLWNHLNAEPESKKTAEEYEKLEILGIVSFLKKRSQNFDYLPKEKDVAAGSAERGKIAFEERGCLACHNHKDFPETKGFRQAGEIVQGPDLSGIGSKFDLKRNPKGREWIYSWIKQPTQYHTRTVMPDLYLSPVPKKDENGKVVSSTDPAADIAEYLLASTNGWEPAKDTLTKLDASMTKSLDKFLVENLKETFYEAAAEKYKKDGIPADMEKELKGAEKELITDGKAPLSDDQKLLYIGRKSITKYGCYGCHDVPGFEDAKPIGTALADWGRKDPAKLAFEHIAHYLHEGHDDHGSAHGSGHGDAHAKEAMPEFYKEQLDAGNRIGFLYQKLAEPRSYDYKKTENKRYNERLRMPQFPFDNGEREDLMTFVLGLVADPPAGKFVYKPDARADALIAGKLVIDKFNCAGCHVLETEKWKVEYAPGGFGEQPETKAYPFLAAHYTPDQLAASKKIDYRGLLTAHLRGMPTINDADGYPVAADSEGDLVEPATKYDPKKLTYAFDLWLPLPLEGKPFKVGVVPLNIPATQLEKKHSSRGGVLAKFLLPRVLQREKQVNPAAKGSEAWAWLPPPLIGEGNKVQSSWLHDFLLNPYPIRPATVLRMPRFNMTSAEATNLVKYFAAVDNADYPYEFSPRRQAPYLAAADSEYKKAGGKASRLDDAMKVVTNGNYCVKCHIVSDFEPKGSDRAKAPNLARVYERLRPDYVRDWIANPKQILPYTSMPVNIPYDAADTKNFGGVSQDLYHGTSIEQLDALVDLLMNYDNFTKQRSLVSPVVQQAAPAAEKPAEKPEDKKEAAAGGE